MTKRGYRFIAPVVDESAAEIRTDLQRLKRDSDSGRRGRMDVFSRNAQALTDKDTIVLSDFTNTTGDAIFDDTLKSPFVCIQGIGQSRPGSHAI